MTEDPGRLEGIELRKWRTRRGLCERTGKPPVDGHGGCECTACFASVVLMAERCGLSDPGEYARMGGRQRGQTTVMLLRLLVYIEANPDEVVAIAGHSRAYAEELVARLLILARKAGVKTDNYLVRPHSPSLRPRSRTFTDHHTDSFLSLASAVWPEAAPVVVRSHAESMRARRDGLRYAFAREGDG